MDVVTGGVAASQCQNRCRESTGPQNTILLSRWVTGRHWCPRQFQVGSLCYIHNHLGTLAKLQNTHLLSLGIPSLHLCIRCQTLKRNVTSRSICSVEKGAQIELLLCFWFLWGGHVWQYCFEIGWKTAICGNNMILRLASEASHLWFAFARCQGSFCLRNKNFQCSKAIKKDIK